MATAAQESEGISPLAVLVLILGLAMMVGVAKNGGLDIDLSQPKGGTSTPCPPDKKPGEVVRGFTAKKLGRVELRCGNHDGGWKHINRRHGPIKPDTYRCIARVLAEAKPTKLQDGQWKYHLSLRGGDWAEVYVRPSKTGGHFIKSAFTKGDDAASKRWTQCVKKAKA